MKSFFFYIFLSLFLLTGCHSETSRDDVQKQTAKARKALQNVREELEDALETQADYLEDRHAYGIQVLQDSIKSINAKIDQLKEANAGGTSTGQQDVNAAITKLEQARVRVDDQLTEVRRRKPEDYDRLQRRMEKSLKELEEALDELQSDLPTVAQQD
ncbi:hypothetical protein SAMN05421823_10795 [Catalinimonas alkaloidigena]|uniref:Uncharacterized protein n=1 Tax=Catalinimonas alkaloidigena TaxID=1075417 RepID=A0A1G9LN88_9BACT|nr:hypothetical protein [Catalinimonas alkaloidigena]SDL62985.1 hypothetical protein SAMN05421823_10795 [Catalinimonas alkaloidigena]